MAFQENCLFPAYEFTQTITGENKERCIARCTYGLAKVSMEHKRMGYNDGVSNLSGEEIFEKAHDFCKKVYEDRKCWF